jgi:hypothetical protein
MSNRIIRLILAILVLVISLTLLIWGFWPPTHLTSVLSFPSGSLQVP